MVAHAPAASGFRLHGARLARQHPHAPVSICHNGLEQYVLVKTVPETAALTNTYHPGRSAVRYRSASASNAPVPIFGRAVFIAGIPSRKGAPVVVVPRGILSLPDGTNFVRHR